MANLWVTVACTMMLAVSVDAFWPWYNWYGGNGGFGGNGGYRSYGLKKGNYYGLNGFSGLGGWGGLWNPTPQVNQGCDFCSSVNSPACCASSGKCCNNEIPNCEENIQCRLRQNCTVFGNAVDYCPLFGCCRLNTIECCPQPAAIFPFDPLWIGSEGQTTTIPRSFWKFPYWQSNGGGLYGAPKSADTVPSPYKPQTPRPTVTPKPPTTVSYAETAPL